MFFIVIGMQSTTHTYSIISALSVPLMAINMSINYTTWTHFDRGDDIESIYSKMVVYNLVTAGAVCLIGAAAIYKIGNKEAEEAKVDFAWKSMAGRIAGRVATIFVLSVALCFSSAAVNNWCYRSNTL